jgi:hypothetical protein
MTIPVRRRVSLHPPEPGPEVGAGAEEAELAASQAASNRNQARQAVDRIQLTIPSWLTDQSSIVLDADRLYTISVHKHASTAFGLRAFLILIALTS